MQYLLLVFAICISMLVVIGTGGKKHWGYEDTPATYGQRKWKDHYPFCGFWTQSPIEIDPKSCAKAVYPKLRLSFSKPQFLNNGHVAQLNVNPMKLTLEGGPLTAKFIAEQFHFHWGSPGNVTAGIGSEHRITGKKTVMEMHVVSYNEKFANLTAAAIQPHGLAVFGVLFTEGKEEAGSIIGDILSEDALGNIPVKGSAYRDPNDAALKLNKLVSMTGLTEKYYSYEGSLTTPPCSETVHWIVSQKTLTVSSCTLSRLQKLKSSTGGNLQDNFRLTQPLHGRKVTCNK